MVKGFTRVTFALDSMVLNSKNKKEVSIIQDGKIMEFVSDGVALLSKASHCLNIFRRQAFKGEIKEESTFLCNASSLVCGRLFGDNLGEKIKDLNESMRVAMQTYCLFHPFRKNRFPFLDRGQPLKQRRRGNALPNQWNHNQNQRKTRRYFN